MASYDVKALFSSVPMDLAFAIVQHRLQQDPLLPPKSSPCWSFALKMHTSSSRVSISNRPMVQPWVPPLAHSLPTCSWKSAKLKPSVLPPPPIYGSGT